MYESHSPPIVEDIDELKVNSVRRLDDVSKNFEQGNEIESRVQNISDNMDEISGKVEEMTRFQECIGTFLIRINQEMK